MGLLGAFVLICAIAAVIGEKAKPCDVSKCLLPKCKCYDTPPQNVSKSDLPQLVLISSDDAITLADYNTYIKRSLVGRTNPDDCPIGATFFVPHDYTDYATVRQLWADGFEIGVHSITKNSSVDYWTKANESLIIQEFGGQKSIISKFAGIPKGDIKGARVPHLQLSGDVYYEGIKKSDLQFDSSWPTALTLWPYTLDYETLAPCMIGTCPTSSIPGVWVSPINFWKTESNTWCTSLHGCRPIPLEQNEIFEWMKQQFEPIYKGSRIPFNILINSAFFGLEKDNFPAYLKFLDYLENLDDVYIVSQSRAIEWVQKPKGVSKVNLWDSCQKQTGETVKKQTCVVKKGEEYRYMSIPANIACPDVYPWLGNPEGKRF